MPKIRCHCNKLLSFKPEQGGKLATCPNCSARLRLPSTHKDAAPAQTGPDNPGELDHRTSSELDQLELDPLPVRQSLSSPEQDELTLETLPPEPPHTEDAYSVSIPSEWPANRPPSIAPQAEEPTLRKPKPPARIPSFWEILPSAFTYPFKGNGGIALIVGVVFFTVAQFVMLVVSFFPMIGGIIALIIGIVILGLFVGYMMSIMLTSSQGEPEAPDWPDLTDYVEDALKPFLFIIGLTFVSLGPLFAYGHFVEDENTILRLALLGGGLFYMPMGLLCISLINDPAALNPVLVVRAICKAFGKYVVAWLLAAACFAAYVLIGMLLDRVLPVPVLVDMVQWAITFYFGLVGARVLGLLYYTSKEELDWIAG